MGVDWGSDHMIPLGLTGGLNYLFLDNFERSTTGNTVGAPQIGNSPTYPNGTWGTNGKVFSSNAEGVISWDVGTTAYVADFTLGYNSAGNDAGFLVRVMNATNFCMVYLYNNQTVLYTRDGGSYNLRATWTAATWVAGDVCRVRVTTGSIAAERKPLGQSSFTSLGSYNTTSYNTYTTIGIRTNNSVWGADLIEVRSPTDV
jgi:hypothetical protein